MKVRQRAPRHVPDLEQVVAATIVILEESGESGFRIETLMDRTGISKSSLYMAFGSRDGLIAAARARQFEAMILESIGPIRQISEQATSRDALRANLHLITAFVADLSRTAQRVERCAVIAGTKGRPEFSQWLAETQTRLSSEFAEIIEDAQLRGFITRKHSARMIGNFIQAVVLGRVIVGFDLDAGPDELAHWTKLVNDIYDRMLFVD